jgi:hypothetical protein
MSDFFDPTNAELIQCVEREIRFRERVYPKQIAGGRMTQARALREIQMMRAILERLRETED